MKFRIGLKTIVTFLLAAVAAPALGVPARADAATVALVLSSDTPEYQTMAGKFKAEFGAPCDEYNLEDSDEKQRQIGEKLKAAPPDVTVVIGDLAGQMAKWYLPDRPLVYGNAPGAAKITLTEMKSAGIYYEPDPALQLKSIKELFPDKTRITALYAKDNTAFDAGAAQNAASELGLSLDLQAVESIKTMPDQLKQILPNAQVLWVLTDPEVLSPHSIQYVVLQSIAGKVPIFCGSNELAHGGATAGLVPDPDDVAAEAAKQAQLVIGGSAPSPGTMVYPRGHLVVNQKTAKILGITFPDAPLAQAEVIQ